MDQWDPPGALTFHAKRNAWRLRVFIVSISLSYPAIHYLQNLYLKSLTQQVIPGSMVNIMSILLNIFAIMTAFFGIYLGFKESVQGIVFNIIKRIIPEEKLNTSTVSVVIILFLWGWVSLDFSIMLLMQLAGPIFGLVACLIPCYLVFKVPSLSNPRSVSNYYVVFYGILLFMSPFLKFLE
ncbi:hypothetical protein [Entomohabitans teleogrylli]|uniref:hypothetical protein n=1 Tax=Entomohabitans teleogrylli TaxID=1384589 RepID=UPI00073D69A3|nr:hypothetical protein [Entomohabitans teleogrylli]